MGGDLWQCWDQTQNLLTCVPDTSNGSKRKGLFCEHHIGTSKSIPKASLNQPPHASTPSHDAHHLAQTRGTLSIKTPEPGVEDAMPPMMEMNTTRAVRQGNTRSTQPRAGYVRSPLGTQRAEPHRACQASR